MKSARIYSFPVGGKDTNRSNLQRNVAGARVIAYTPRQPSLTERIRNDHIPFGTNFASRKRR